MSDKQDQVMTLSYIINLIMSSSIGFIIISLTYDKAYD